MVLFSRITHFSIKLSIKHRTNATFEVKIFKNGHATMNSMKITSLKNLYTYSSSFDLNFNLKADPIIDLCSMCVITQIEKLMGMAPVIIANLHPMTGGMRIAIKTGAIPTF